MTAPRRSRSDAEALTGLAARLTPRDFAILQFLAEHRIATTAILAAIFFTHRRRAAARLQELCTLELLNRTRIAGSGTYRYTLAWTGAAVCALRSGTAPPSKTAVAWASHQIILSAHRPHKEGVNAFCAQLHLAARAAGNATVTEWLPEAAAAAEIIGARPDAAGTLTWADGRELRFWYEHDRGTEPLTALADKINRYRTGRLAGTLGDRVLLFGLPTTARLHGLQRINPAPGNLTVAATVTQPLLATGDLASASPALLYEARWLLIGTDHTTALEALAH